MAEELDSFFKKKKTKGKKKYTTSDSIKKAVEDSQKVEEQKKSLPNDEDTQINDPVRGNDHHWACRILYQRMCMLRIIGMGLRTGITLVAISTTAKSGVTGNILY